MIQAKPAERVLGSFTARGGNGTGADGTAWWQSKPVTPATLFALVRTPSGRMFVVQYVTESLSELKTSNVLPEAHWMRFHTSMRTKVRHCQTHTLDDKNTDMSVQLSDTQNETAV